jgi:hypothetical protein
VSFGDVLGLTVFEGVFGLLILLILWPTRRSATRLLTRWGIEQPTEAELGQALTYLRRRRFWYPWLFIGLPAIGDATGVLPSNGDNSAWAFPAMLLIGALLAEVFAQRRSPASVRSAVPVHRGLTDIVPGWALALLALATLATLVMLGSALAGAPWAQHWYPHWSARVLWIALGSAVVTVLVIMIVVGLALRRPAIAELRLDPVLRTRSARVPVGIGIAMLCTVIGGGEGAFRGMIIIVAGLFLWSAVAGPVRKPVRV